MNQHKVKGMLPGKVSPRRQIIRMYKDELNAVWSIVTQNETNLYIAYTNGVYDLLDSRDQKYIDNVAYTWGHRNIDNIKAITYYNKNYKNAIFIMRNSTEYTDILLLGLFYLSHCIRKKILLLANIPELTKSIEINIQQRKYLLKRKTNFLENDFLSDRLFVSYSRTYYQHLITKGISQPLC